MTVAIDVKPMLSLRESSGVFFYTVDSGETDLNRVLASNSLSSLNLADINISGFDKYTFLKSQKEVDEFVSKKKHDALPNAFKDLEDTSSSDEKPLEPVHVKKTEVKKDEGLAVQDSFAIVEGKVSLLLSDGELVDIAHPVYRVYPDKKGNYIDIEQIKSYVSKQWVDEIRGSLFNISSDANSSSGNSVSNVKNSAVGSSISNATFMKIVGGLTLVLLLLVVASSVFNKNKSSTDFMGNSSVTAQALQEAGIATPPILASNSGASSNTGFFQTLTPQESTAENLAKVQAQQTEAMLKQMGVDLSATEQDLGCFVSGG